MTIQNHGVIPAEKNFVPEERYCGHCDCRLEVPLGLQDLAAEAAKLAASSPLLGKQHGNVYVSNYGGFYCSRECAALYTED